MKLRELWDLKYAQAKQLHEELEKLYPVGSDINWNWHGHIQTGTVEQVYVTTDFSVINTRTGKKVCISFVDVVMGEGYLLGQYEVKKGLIT